MFLLFIVLAADKHTPQLSGRVEERNVVTKVASAGQEKIA